jgi:hypothetical protein
VVLLAVVVVFASASSRSPQERNARRFLTHLDNVVAAVRQVCWHGSADSQERMQIARRAVR